MKIGTKGKILPSNELERMGLMPLAGVTGIVMQTVHDKEGKLTGAWVRLPGKWQGEREWFIPEVSLSMI